MNLKDYFENRQGLGVLATADAEGRVDVAVYARPHVVDDETVRLIMADRLSHANVQSNPHAAYLFHEKGPGYEGVRLHLTMTGEETSPAKIQEVRRRTTPDICKGEEGDQRFLVTFRVDRVRPLVGDGELE
jgi:predicted pyridoxine 5'-phosphate oxidase superfamily flavin-nucleotide-binding protein